MFFLLVVLVAVTLAYYLAEPLTRTPESSADQRSSLTENNDARIVYETLIQELKDLEMDYAGGKFTESEYQSRKETLLSRLAALPESRPPSS